MNELYEIFKDARDGDRITLENKIYEVAPEDGFHLKGFFFSNTANLNCAVINYLYRE